MLPIQGVTTRYRLDRKLNSRLFDFFSYF